MAMCVGALILLSMSSRSGPAESAVPRLTLAMSNVDFATYYAAAGQSDHNILSTTFEWTNGAHSTTTAPSVFDRPGYRE